MAGLLQNHEMAKALWPGVKAKFEEQYASPIVLWDFKGFFYTYRTSPLFGIFKIRSYE